VPAVWQAASDSAAAQAIAPKSVLFMPASSRRAARQNAGQTRRVVSANYPDARPTRVKRVRLYRSSGFPGSATSNVSTNSSLE
jgi:hypothetical protein